MKTFLEKHSGIKKLICAICGYLAVLSVSKIFALKSDISNYFTGLYWGYNVGAIFVFIFGAYFLYRFLENEDKRLKKLSVVAGVLLSASCVYGAYAHYLNDIFISVKDVIFQLLFIVGISFITVPLSAEIFQLTNRASTWMLPKISGGGIENKEKPSWKKQLLYYVCNWAIIFVSYIPIFLCNWPGNFIYDAKYQMAEVFFYSYRTHHPLAHTLLMGWAYELGIDMRNVSAGFQFYTLIQMLVLAASFAYCLLYMYKKQVKRCIRIGALLWFALFPLNVLFSITATKDVLCAAFFLFGVIFYIRYFYDKEKFKWYSYVGMIASNVLLCLYRNNASYAVILFLVLGIIFMKGWKEKLKILTILAIIYVITGLCNDALIKSVDAIENDTYRESLSVPLQCLARVADYRRDELPDELYNEIVMYIQESDIPNYNPYNSDFIKNNANETLLKENTLSFFKLWVKVGLMFPDEYVESLVTNTLAYWFPLNQGGYTLTGISLYHTMIDGGPQVTKENYFPLANEIYFPLFCEGDAQYTPVLGYLMRPIVYVWFFIYGFIWSVYRKDKKSLLLLCLPLVYLLTCFAGPLVAVRYVYCIIVCVPIFIYLMINTNKKEE